MKHNYLPFLLPFRCVIFLLIFIGTAFFTGKPFNEFSNIWSILASLVNIVTILLLVCLSRKIGGYASLINYQKGITKPAQIVRMTFLVLFVGMGGMYLAGFLCYGILPYAAPMLIAPIPLPVALLNLPLLPITTAFAEDALYLGCGVNQIKNKTAAILLPAFFFALQHSFIPFLPDARYLLYRFLCFLPLTILLCIHYHKHRNPLPIMVGHAIIDVLTVAQILGTSAVPGFYEMMCNL